MLGVFPALLRGSELESSPGEGSAAWSLAPGTVGLGPDFFESSFLEPSPLAAESCRAELLAELSESREETIKTPSRDLARAVTYIPDMDGQADAGEVVWANIRPKKGMVPEQRAVLVVGRNHHRLLTLLISSREEYADKINWIPVGTGPWSTGADLDSWVRMDKVLQVPESHIQRRGIPLPARRFERVANELRQVYGWS